MDLLKKLYEAEYAKRVVKMDSVSTDGTAKRGTLPEGTTYSSIIKVFGEPSELNPGDDVQVEWSGTIDGNVFTIYDYNIKVKPEYNERWNIGSKDTYTARLVLDYFNRNK